MSKILIKQRPLLTRPENFQGVSTFVAQILARRGVASEQELELKLKHLLAPSMKGLPEAIQLMDQAIDQQKKNCNCGRLRCRWRDQYHTYDFGIARNGRTGAVFST